jgi:hypothetical protein
MFDDYASQNFDEALKAQRMGALAMVSPYIELGGDRATES